MSARCCGPGRLPSRGRRRFRARPPPPPRRAAAGAPAGSPRGRRSPAPRRPRRRRPGSRSSRRAGATASIVFRPSPGDVGDHRLAVADLAALGQPAQHRDRDAAGGLGEDAGGRGQQPDAVDDLVVVGGLDRCRRCARATLERERRRRPGCRSRATWRSRSGRTGTTRRRRRPRTPSRPARSPAPWAPCMHRRRPRVDQPGRSALARSPAGSWCRASPEAIGATTRSGARQPSCSAVSRAIVFEPSE